MGAVKIPYAVSNYSKLRSSGYTYIDKTEYKLNDLEIILRMEQKQEKQINDYEQ